MDYCLICFVPIVPKMGWSDLIAKEKKQIICSSCQNKLQEIEGETCRICSRPLSRLDSKFIEGETCSDCVRWENDPEWSGCLERNQSLFLYNEFLQEVIARYKFRGDYILASLFSEKLFTYIAKQQTDFIVPIPLSSERLQERGFNQAEALIIEAGLEPSNLLTRKHLEKQSKKSRNERIHSPQVFQFKQNIELTGKSILLVDDIYTTGSTLRHAAKLLKAHGAGSVSSITIARG